MQSTPKTVTELKAEVTRLRQEIVDLTHNVEVYRKLAFGPSSEKRGDKPVAGEHLKQGHLYYLDLVAEARETALRKQLDGSITAAPPKKPKGKGGRRSRFPENVPSVTTEYKRRDKGLTCKCGGSLYQMSFETTKGLERLEQPYLHILKRAKYACRKCGNGVQTTPGPDRPFEKGILGTGFLSYLITERFGDHMPYYRIEKKHARGARVE